MVKLFWLIIILNFVSYAQFDSLIFHKTLNLNFSFRDIYPLGNQNSDGYDDFLLYDCNEERGYIFYGGNPVDTIPDFSIKFFDTTNVRGEIALIDLNDDGVKDIVITTIKYYSYYYHPGDVRIYYGGSVIDTLPDLIFKAPEGASNNFGGIRILQDFNGDGRSELIIYDPNLPYSGKQYGTFYFYNTQAQFDTIPYYIMKGDSASLLRYLNIGSSGDINGDGKTDFTLRGYIGTPTNNIGFRSFYLGNENFDLDPAVTYYDNEHTFDTDNWQIINDINGDHKDDILIHDYGFYPYYYLNAILHGSFPIDTIPALGLNTQNEGLGETYSLGDVNGDGYNDFFGKTLIFGYPNVKLWVGGRNMPYTSDDQANRTWYGTSGGFGSVISNIGDVDGDNVNDIVIGERPFINECDVGHIYIFKGDTSVLGDTGTVDVLNENNNILGYALYDPYPNPFNPMTIISFEIPERTSVDLVVYDILGRRVKSLISNELKNPGRYEINFNANSLASGVYIYKLTTKKYSQVRKMLLAK